MDYDDRWQRAQERWSRRQERWAEKQQRWAMKQQRSANHHHSPLQGVLIGGMIIAIGGLLLLNNLGIVQVRDIWQFWPVILIVVGVARLVEAHGPAAVIWGALICGAGGLLLAQNLNLIYFDWHVVWPLLIIGWGLIILVRPKNWLGPTAPPAPGPPPAAGTTSSAGTQAGPGPDAGPAFQAGPSRGFPVSDPSTIGLWTLFGGGRRQVDSQDFRGGEISAVFGGYEVDLRNAAVRETAVIDVTAVFGGVELRVPGTWTVEARGVGIFGGFTDETRPPRPGEVTREQRLIVTGTAAFGGVSIKN